MKKLLMLVVTLMLRSQPGRCANWFPQRSTGSSSTDKSAPWQT